MPGNRHDIQVLNDLIGATLDSAERLDRVAQDGDSSGHDAVFAGLAAERRASAAMLSEHVVALGGHPETGGSILAKAQRALMDVSHALLRDDAGLVGAADDGEQALIRRFDKALADDALSATTRETVRRARIGLREEQQDVQGLRRSLEGQRDAGSSLYPQ